MAETLPIVNSLNELQGSNRQQSMALRQVMSAGFFDVTKSVNRLATRLSGGSASRAEPTQEFIQRSEQGGGFDILQALDTFFGFQTQNQARKIALMEDEQRIKEQQLLIVQTEFVKQQGQFAQVFSGMSELFAEMARLLRDIQVQANAIRMIVNSQFEFFLRNKQEEYGLERNKFIIQMAQQGVNPLDPMFNAAIDDFQRKTDELVKYNRQVMEVKKSAAMLDRQGNLVQDPVLDRIDESLNKVIAIANDTNDKLGSIGDQTRQNTETNRETNSDQKKNQQNNAGVWAGMLAYLKGLKKNSDAQIDDDMERGGGFGGLGDPDNPSNARNWKAWIIGILSAIGVTYALNEASKAAYDPYAVKLEKPQQDLLFEQTEKNDAEERRLRDELADPNTSDVRKGEIQKRLGEIDEQNRKIKYRWDLHYRNQLLEQQRSAAKDQYDPEVQTYMDRVRRGELPMPDWWQEELDKEALSKMSSAKSRLSTSGANLSADEIEMLMRAAPTSPVTKPGENMNTRSAEQAAQPTIVPVPVPAGGGGGGDTYNIKNEGGKTIMTAPPSPAKDGKPSSSLKLLRRNQ